MLELVPVGCPPSRKEAAWPEAGGSRVLGCTQLGVRGHAQGGRVGWGTEEQGHKTYKYLVLRASFYSTL